MGLFTKKTVIVDATDRRLEEIAYSGEKLGSVRISGVTFGGSPDGDVIYHINNLIETARQIHRERKTAIALERQKQDALTPPA